MSARPEDLSRRSQLYRWHQQHGARFGEIGGATFVQSYEHDRPLPLMLCDFSLLPRTGLKGHAAPDWLVERIGPIPDAPNRAIHTENGVIARLSEQEFLLLGRSDFDATFIQHIDRQLRESPADGIYGLPRADSHCLFTLSGPQAPDALAKICGVDLRPKAFATGCIAQTSLARVNAIVIRCDPGESIRYFILCDTAAAEFMWESIHYSIEEFGGGAAGTRDLKQPMSGRVR